MILDIRYTDKSPEQIQGVRMMTVYPRMDSGVNPEFVVHFQDYTKPTRYIDQSNVLTVTVTND